jgi:glycerol-3-phosphate cytidylyltransferase-like family protein
MVERLISPFEKEKIIWDIAEEIHPAMQRTALLLAGVEDPSEYLPNTEYKVDRVALQFTKETNESIFFGISRRQRENAALMEIGNELARPRTIREFQKLKYATIAFAENREYIITSVYPQLQEGLTNGRLIDNDLLYSFNVLRETTQAYFNMAGALSIIQSERYNSEIAGPVVLGDQMWRRIEGDKVEDSPRPNVFTQLAELKHSLDQFRETNYLKTCVPRVGLMFGDFRVGFHPDHSRLAQNAKLALGKGGRLVVVTPTKEVIQKVNHKSPVWDDGIRVPLIANDRSVNDILLSDMDPEYYENPTLHWADVWKTIDPDLVFLGEVNHPLEPIYRFQSKRLGGILLIDDSIDNGIRSGSLLEDFI